MRIDTENMKSVEQFINDTKFILNEVDEFGQVLIIKDNKPAYILMKYDGQVLLPESAPRLKLHEAMEKVLKEEPLQRLHAKDLADKIYEQGLYLKQDGTKAKASQIRARCNNYGHMFVALKGNIIKLL